MGTLILDLCSEDPGCSYWTFVYNFHFGYFNCTLLSSCDERKVYAYPNKTSSGEKVCDIDSDSEKRRKCQPACKAHAPFCHGRCLFFGRACLFAPCSASPFRKAFNNKKHFNFDICRNSFPPLP